MRVGGVFHQHIGRVSPRKRDNESEWQLSPEQAAAAAMVAEAKARGLELTGPNGLLKLFTKNVLETALNEELTEHLTSPYQRTPAINLRSFTGAADRRVTLADLDKKSDKPSASSRK